MSAECIQLNGTWLDSNDSRFSGEYSELFPDWFWNNITNITNASQSGNKGLF